ncbi:MAG: 4-hydroxythreonine-4-phosphate dehydrogenase PdxA [Alphaproteobacteria bacterium]
MSGLAKGAQAGPATALVLTMGDPAGIGPDITLQAWAKRRAHRLAPFAVIGAPQVYRDRAKLLGLSVPVVEIGTCSEAVEMFEQGLPVLSVACGPVECGKPAFANAGAVVEAIEQAVALCRQGAAPAMVTAPIAKSVLQESGFAHPGHTEFLGHLVADGGAPPRAVMMLAAPGLRVVPVTVHMALARVPQSLTIEAIVETGVILATDLAKYFGLAAPRIAVCGLNPHAGEGGYMGDEEARIVGPAIAALVARGIDATGPLAADSAFAPRIRETFDAALCMYHDQALIPIKALAFDEAVNVTLGLPIVRTSPDHGTAFDIAGSGTAREVSLVAALHMARAMAEAAKPRN